MKILVGVNGGEEQRDALALASQLAAVEGSLIVAAHAFPWSPVAEILDPSYNRHLEEHGAAHLATAREQLGAVPCETRLLRHTSPPHALHDLARDERFDVLVVGSTHRGHLGRATLGGVGDRLLPGATCPVVVAPRGHAASSRPLRRIGAGYDAGTESLGAVAWACDLALRSGASLTLLRAYSPPPVATYPTFGVAPNEALVRRVREDAERSVASEVAALPAAVEPSGRAISGRPSAVLATAATELGLDLLVVGSRGYGPVGALLLGSTSHAVIHDAPCPVMVLPRTAIAAPERPAAAAAVAPA
jgi:nucleotide-binding universal stress UspA family protein